MPLKRKRKTESEVIEQPEAGAGPEKTEEIPASTGSNGSAAPGPSAWNLDAFAPYQGAGAQEPPVGTVEADRTDVFPAGLLHEFVTPASGEAESTDVFDRSQLTEMTAAYETPSQFDRTLDIADPAQFEKTAAYDATTNGLTAHSDPKTPEFEPMPSIFASFQEQSALNSTQLFDDAIPSVPTAPPVHDLPAFDAPKFDAPEPIAPVFEPPVFEASPMPSPSMNTTQRFNSEDLGIAAPLDEGPANTTRPSYTGAQTFSGSPLMEPEAEKPSAFAATGRLIVRLGRFSASYEVDRPEILIGRPDPESEIFPEVAIEWDDAISRRHARILHKDDGDYVEDTGSTNGTKLNGVPLGAHDPQRLHSGDLIHVGSRTEIIYYE